MNLLKRALATEEITDGKARIEKELTYYARVLDFEELLKANNREHHEQWQLKIPHSPKNAGPGTIRIRKNIPHITDIGATTYVLTTKLNTNDNISKVESSVESSASQFTAFRIMCDSGMIKDRYSFNIPDTDLVWEVDMFYLDGAEVGSGRYHDWCKIDLEHKEPLESIPPLPIRLHDLITAQKGERPPETESIVNGLYENIFNAKNQILVGGN